MMDLHEAARVMGGVHHGENRVFTAVSTDSRMIDSAYLFFAINTMAKKDGAFSWMV